MSGGSVSTISQIEGNESSYAERSNSTLTLRKRHHIIKKQLRFMFLYPVVYLLMWLAPFVSHCYRYTKIAPPFTLDTLALASATLQGAADCIIFMLREKPWRHIQPIRIPGSKIEIFGPKTKQRTDTGLRSFGRRPTTLVQTGRKQSRHWWDTDAFRAESPAVRACQ